jgi:tRNA U34 5-methylaminomethyl-2-thiouridine-forming methyltransferase MnmC
LTAQRQGARIINYHSLEPLPLSNEIIQEINYGELLNYAELFFSLHNSDWDKKIELIKNFHLTKHKSKLLDFRTSEKFDLIYYDAFAPSKQSDMWDIPPLKYIYDLMNFDAIFVTYSAAGEFKRNLKKIGFQIEKLPGANGKKEMTRARKIKK